LDPSAARSLETGTPELLCRVEQRVAVVTLNRPEARNALTGAMKHALLELLPALARDPEVGCVLFTGAGDAFCAGGDTKKMVREGSPSSPEERTRQLQREHGIPLAIHRLPKPVLASLPGPAAGAGFALALSCDLRLLAQSAFVTTAYVKLGLSGDYGVSWFLTRLVGPARAREILFTGDSLSADTCLQLGLANRVVPDAQLEEEALGLARRLAAGQPIALAYMKDNLNRALRGELEELLELEARRMVAGATSEDYREALRARQEKRPPVFRGR